MKEEYKVVRRFECCGKTMVAVQMNGSSVSTMTMEEWERLDRRNKTKK